MNDQQVAEIIRAMNTLGEKIALQKYTLTGAADWPLLVVVGGAVVTLIIFMWMDLRATIKEHRQEWRGALQKEVDLLWSEARGVRQDMKECKERCLDHFKEKSQ